MKIDNSAFSMYMFCPSKFYERYEYVLPVQSQGSGSQREGDVGAALPIGGAPAAGIEPINSNRAGLDFGTRFHQLYEEHSRGLMAGPPRVDTNDVAGEGRIQESSEIEDEVQAVWAAYLAHYPTEPFEILSCEQTREIPIPGTGHSLVVKLDRAVRFGDGTIGPMDLKTESTAGYNTRESWAGRTQASLYLWALQELYPREQVSRLVVDIVTRGNSKRGPTFTRLDDIARPPEALDDAIRNVVYVCDQIESHRRSGWWPRNMNVCKDGWKVCEYYPLHVYGKTEANLSLYKPAEPYLDVPK